MKNQKSWMSCSEVENANRRRSAGQPWEGGQAAPGRGSMQPQLQLMCFEKGRDGYSPHVKDLCGSQQDSYNPLLPF